MAFMLRDGVSYRTVGDSDIILDTDRNRYFSVPAHWLIDFAGADSADEIDPAARTLLDHDLVQEAPATGFHPIEACRHEIPSTAFQPDPLRDGLPAGSVSSAFWLLARATVAIRLFPLSRLLRSPRLSTRAGSIDPATEFSRALAAFQAARRWFPGRDTCLRDAIALRACLARLGYHVRIVFGASQRPFLAHCWLELDNELFGQDYERIAQFAPIRVVG